MPRVMHSVSWIQCNGMGHARVTEDVCCLVAAMIFCGEGANCFVLMCLCVCVWRKLFIWHTIRIAQWVTCLATDACLTAIPGVASSITARSHTFLEIDHEIISMVIPLIHSRRVVVSYMRKYVHEVLVNRLFKPAQEKVWLGELTVPQWP